MAGCCKVLLILNGSDFFLHTLWDRFSVAIDLRPMEVEDE